MPENKQYFIQMPGIDGLGKWDVETYEQKKHSLFKKHPEATVVEFEAYNGSDPVEDNDMFHIVLDGFEGEGKWDAKTFSEKKDKLFAKHPNAKVYRSRGVDYWYDKALADEESLKTMQGELEALNQELGGKQRWSPEYNAIEAQISDKRGQMAQTQSGYDANPRVIEANERYAAEYATALEEYKKNYLPNLRKRINKDFEEDVDMGKASRKNKIDLTGDAEQMALLSDIIADDTPGTSLEESHKKEQYQTALAFLDKAERIRNEHSSFLQGAKDAGLSWVESAASQSDLETYTELYTILSGLEDKLVKKGKDLNNLSEEDIEQNLSRSEKALVLAFFEYNAALEEVKDSTRWEYKAGQIGVEVVPLIVEFMLTGGMAQGAGKAVTKGLSKALTSWIKGATKGSFRRTARRLISKGVRGGISGLTQAAVITPLRPTAYANVAKSTTQIGEDGRLKDSAADIAVAVADEYIETLSELTGGAISKLIGTPAKWLGGKVLGKETFEKWSTALLDNNVTKFLARGQFHGMPVEIAEEYFGNALREIYDHKALDRMHEGDNFLSMVIGFAPMTLLGAGVGYGQYAYAKHSVNKNAAKLRDILLADGFDKNQVEHLVNFEKELTPESLSKELDPVLEAMKAKGASKESRQAVVDYAIAVGRYKAMKGAVSTQETQLRKDKLAELEGTWGKFYQTKNEGTKWQEQNVTTAVLYDGRSVFLVSDKNNMGEYAAIDAETGEQMPVSESDISIIEDAQGNGAAAITTQSLDSYLTELIMSERKTDEDMRMEQEKANQIVGLQQRLAQEGRLNIGTSDAPVYIAYLPEQSNDGMAHFTQEDGTESILTWEQVGDYLGQPIRTLTDAQMHEAEAAALEAEEAERRAEKAQTNKQVDEADETAEEAAQSVQNAAPVHIPMNPDGTVNTDLFWDQNPEEWAKWNDGQRQDGGADSMAQIAAGMQTAEAKLAEASKLPFATPTQREARDKEMGFWQDKINRYNAMLEQYQLAEAAKETEKARAYAAERLAEAEAVLADKQKKAPKRSDYRFTPQYMQAKQKFDAEVAALQEEVTRWQNELAQYGEMPVQQEEAAPAENVSVVEEQQPEVVAPTKEELADQLDDMLAAGASRSDEAVVASMQAYADSIASGVPVKVVTRRNVVQVLKEAGVSETKIAEVKDALRRIQYIVNGFEANGVAYIMADSVMAADHLRNTYVHERQHVMTAQSGLAAVLMVMTTREELQGLVAKIVRSGFYGGKSHMVLADELISMAMERGYNGEGIEDFFEDLGYENRKVIEFIKSIDNAQRNDSGLSLARVAEIGGNTAEGGSRQDGRTPNTGSTEVGEQGPRPDGGVGETAGDNTSERGVGFSVSPNEAVSEATEILDKKGLGVDTQNEDVRFSVRYIPTKDQREAILSSIMAVTGRTREVAEKWLDSETSLAAMVGEEIQYLDYPVDSKYKAIKDNSDYPQGTVDFNNICRKRLSFTQMFTRLQRRFPNRVFTADELADIRTIMSQDGLTVACGLCYVEDRRQMVGEVANSFINELQKGFADYASENATKRRNADKFLALIGEDAYVPSIYDLTTQEGADKLYNEHRGIWEAFQAFNNARGQQSQNLLQGYAEYKREILSWSDKKVKSVNDNGGLRIFSYSDFEAHHLLDIVQIIIDCAAKGVKIQGYTKVPAFARAVANTGIKLNRSLIPLGDTGIVDGQLAFDPVEGIDVNDPDFLESNDNVGNILIGINDVQIRMAMADPRIHYIIPYHARQKENIRKKLNVGEWVNYISTQNERNLSDGKRVKDNVNIYTEVLTDDVTNDRQFVEKYLQICKEKGRIPKFDQFLNKDAEGNYVYTPGYHKFLVDFKLFDENGNILPQQPVVAEFDDAFNMQILEDYAKGERESTGDQMNETYDKIVDALGLDESAAEGEDVRFSVIKEVNAQFNQRLAELEADPTQKDRVLHLGRPSVFLMRGGVRDAEILLEYDKFVRKSAEAYKNDHPFTAKDITDLPLAIYAPIASFNSTNGREQIILTELKKDGNNFVVVVRATRHPRKGGAILEVNDIQTLYPKKAKGIINWILTGKTTQMDTEKALNWIGALQTHLGTELSQQELSTAAKVVKDFVNPNLMISPEQDKAYKDAVEAGDMETAQRMVLEAAKLAMPNTKVVDENGNPKVVYHQTNAKVYVNRETGQNWDELNWKEKMEWDERDDWEDYWEEQDFNTFSRVNARTTNEFDGFFFAPKYDEYHEYGERTIAAFVNIQNPASREDYNIDSRYSDAGRAERIRLQEAGFDGVIRMDGEEVDEYIAFEPSQIKSAEAVTYDDAGNVIPLSERFNPEKSDIRFSVIGERGAAADKTPEGVTRYANLAVARQMESELKPDWSAKENEAALKIKMATGWERGADGKWRYETSDIQMKPIEDWLFNKKKMILKDVVEPGMLLELYPDLGDVVIKKNKAILDNGAWYNDATNEMQLPFAFMRRVHELAPTSEAWAQRLKEWTKDLKESIIHETQHYIQDKEGFARGGNESIVIDPAARAMIDEYLTEMDKFLKVYDSLAASDKSQSYGRFLLNQYDTYGKKVQDIMKKFGIGREGYMKLGGEVESRNTETRASMTAEERRNSLLASTEDVAREDQILIDNDFRLMESEIRFSASNANQAIFVSNAAKAVEGIKQEKATPAQWLAMLEKNGGLKAAEDKWMGLSDWLKESDKKSLTKAEVLDFINENMIVIEETHYSEAAEGGAAAQHELLEQTVNKRYKEILNGLKDIEDYDERRFRAFDIFQEELGEFAELVGLERYGVYLTFPYEDIGDYIEMADAFGVEINLGNPIHETRLNYTTDGLDNRREIALTVPTIESWNESDDIHFGDAGDGRAVAWIRFGDTKLTEVANTDYQPKNNVEREIKDYIEMGMSRWGYSLEECIGYAYNQITDAPSEAVGWTEKAVDNVAKGMRGETIEIAKVLVIDEIQSNRHQEGRKRGYKDIREIRAIQKRKAEIEAEIKSLAGAVLDGDRAAKRQQDALFREHRELSLQRVRGEIPDAPFEKNWPELAMKRMLRYAAENGYDYIAWTKGEQQAERYNIGTAVEKIILPGGWIENNSDKLNGEKVRPIYVVSKNMYDFSLSVNEQGVVVDGGYTGQYLSDVVGKEMAVKLMTAEPGTSIEGDELRIGGEGMKGFYDKMLPAFMNKYGKKWGIKVADITLPNVEEAGRVMHSVPVTEEMKASVMEGQTMFSVQLNPEVRAEMDVITATAMVNGSYMKAPNGQPTKLTEDQWALVRTKNFINWFGDWENDPENASKVIDENGEPMVVYHGSPYGAITQFDRRGHSVSGLKEFGTYFSTSKELAQLYAYARQQAKGDVEKYELEKARLDAIIFDNETPARIALDAFDELDRLEESQKPRVYEVFLNIRKPKVFDAGRSNGWDGWHKLKQDVGYDIKSGVEAIEAISGHNRAARMNETYDGIIAKNIADVHSEASEDLMGDVFLVFDETPENIKSATETTGLFSESGDIRFSAIGRNRFGEIYELGDHTAIEAANFLLSNGEGYIKGVFSNKDFPSIDMAYGNENGGLYHIYLKHILESNDFNSVSDMINAVIDVLRNGARVDQGTNVSYDFNGYRVSLAQSDEGVWLLTSFDSLRSRKDKKKESNTTIGDQSAANEMNGTLVSSDSFNSKDSDNIENNNIEENISFSVRTKPAPKKVKRAYKLFNVDSEGKPHALFIDGANALDEKVWYDADSPLIKDLENLESGYTYYVDKDGNAERKTYKNKKQSPSKEELADAAAKGGRYIYVGTYANGEKSFYNWGVNGGKNGGSVSQFAMRPGWHLTDSPSARHIGAGRNPEAKQEAMYRKPNQRWFEVEYAADVDYNEEAKANPTGDIQTHIPEDGYYSFKTNTAANDVNQNWIISGAIRIVKPLTREQVSKLNEENGVPDDLDYENGTMFSISERPVDEIVDDGVQKVSEEGKKAKASLKQRLDDIDSKLYYVMRLIASAQKRYDKRTVDIMTNLAKELLRDGALSDMTRGEINRLLAAIKNATGKADLTDSANRLMDLMVSNQLRHAKNTFAQMLKIKASKVNASGVEAQGTLDVVGQRLIATVSDAVKLDLSQIDDRIAEAKEKMDSDSETIRKNAEIDLAALEIARKYVDGVAASEKEESDLRHELESAIEDKKADKMTAEGLREFRKATEDAIRENRIQRTSAYRSILGEMAKMITESVTRAGEFRNAEKERIERIHHYANSDLEGLPADAHTMKESAFWNSNIVRFFLKPLSSFEQWMKKLGGKNAEGKGYLYDHFIPGWVEATNKEFSGTMEAYSQLDAKVREVFGGKVKRWSDLFAMEKKLHKMTVKMWDDNKMKEFELSQGNLLYIYMVNKMTDGKMKLRRMGITEEDVRNIYNNLDPRFIELAEWIQNDFLPSLRDKYNAVHERMFGAPMAAIDNYFPIRVLANARTREVEVGTPEGNSNPSTITGSIIKRTKNSLALDVLGSDAFDVVLEHIQQMEHWAAFAEWNRDLNTLLSYKKFRNRVQNMSGIYGAGAKAWEEFRASAEIAAGVYKPKISAMDKILNKVVRGLTAGKIGFRLWTAMKQILSAPAFAPYTSPASMLKNMAMPKSSWEWAMENLEGFRKRWKSRDMGNVRLKKNATGIERWTDDWMDTMTRVGMTPNAFVDALTCAIGAKSVYETAYAKYEGQGYPAEEARRKALVDATVAFNTTQQSGEGAFLSSLQADRDMAAYMTTTYRNANFGMGREFFDAARNLKHRMTPGYKAESIAFMTKQMMRDGLSEANAKRAAERIYRNGVFKDSARVVTFGFALQFLWNMGSSLVYQLFGDDDEQKQKMIEDAAFRAFFGPIENLTLGNVILDGVMMAKEGDISKFNPSLSPAGQDLTRLIETLSTDPIAGVSDLVNIIVQTMVGTNPQVAMDAALAIYDACNGDMETSKEVGVALLRILQAPQSQIDKIIEDEIDFTKDKGLDLTIEEFARRYAEYKHKRNAAWTFYLYSDEEEKKKEDRYIKRFIKRAEELKRTRGNEEAKAWYDYVDNEYKEIGQTLNELREGYESSVKREDNVSAYEFAQKLQELMQTPEYKKYKEMEGGVKVAEKLKQSMKDYPQRRDEYEDKMLEIRKQLVEELQKAE
jgi:hypothetical protein